MAHNKTFISWLQNAYGLERELLQVLEAHHDQAEGHPDVQARIKKHLAETKSHEEKIESCLRDLDVEPSDVKAVWGGLKGNLGGAMSGLSDDRLVQNGMADYATEYYEIAMYSALIEAAQNLGHPEIADACKEIREEEQDMADWLEANLPKAVNAYIDEKREDDEE